MVAELNAIVLREPRGGSCKALLDLLSLLAEPPDRVLVQTLLVWGPPRGSMTFEGALVSQGDTLRIEYYYAGKPVHNEKKIDHYMDRKEAIKALLDDADLVLVIAGENPPKHFGEIIGRMEKRKKRVVRHQL